MKLNLSLPKAFRFVMALAVFVVNLYPASAQTAASRFATLTGHRIHYLSYGEGREAIVFVHGGVGNLNNWKLQTPAFAGKKRLILLDLLGHGQSDKPKVTYSMDLFAQAVDSVLRDAGVEKAVLVGISMGTPVIRQFYRRYPEKTEALVFVDGPLRPLAPTQEIGEEFIAPFRKPNYMEAARQFNAGLMTGKIPAEMREQILSSWANTPQHVIISVLEQVILPKSDPSIWKEDPIKVPVLGIYTRNDYVPADNEQYLRRLAPGAEYHAWSDVGHGIPMEMPQEFNNTLQAFLVKVGWLDDKKGQRKETPIKYFEAFIGEWEAPPDVKEKHPELKGKIQKIFEWGSHKRPVRILEGCLFNQRGDCMLEGFSFWNPVTGRVEYYAYNNEADLLYKGEYTLLEKDKLHMVFEVFYPSDHDFAKRGHPVILFRVAYSLRNADTLDINILYFNKKDNRWDPWGGDDGKGNYVAVRRKTQ
ncbi:MAG: alpha/beta hydrolase [Acidobacteriota bacterium]